MSWSDATASPAFEDVRRTAALEALAREEFAPGPTRDAALSEARGNTTGSTAGPTAWRVHRIKKILAVTQIAAVASVDSSADDPTSRLVDRIIAAKHHREIIDVLPLLGLRAIADRLGYLDEITKDDDPEEPRMALASLRALALFFVSEPPQDAEPEIGISPDGLLQAEWRVRHGGILAMKFRPDGLIQFAAFARKTGRQSPLRVHGTLPKDRALNAVRGFLR